METGLVLCRRNGVESLPQDACVSRIHSLAIRVCLGWGDWDLWSTELGGTEQPHLPATICLLKGLGERIHQLPTYVLMVKHLHTHTTMPTVYNYT